jgi:hypothetical protein
LQVATQVRVFAFGIQASFLEGKKTWKNISEYLHGNKKKGTMRNMAQIYY